MVKTLIHRQKGGEVHLLPHPLLPLLQESLALLLEVEKMIPRLEYLKLPKLFCTKPEMWMMFGIRLRGFSSELSDCTTGQTFSGKFRKRTVCHQSVAGDGF